MLTTAALTKVAKFLKEDAMRIFGLLILVFGLWACSKSSSPDAAQFTTGGFASLKADGTIDVDLTDRTDGIYIDGNGQGFSYVLD